MCYAYTAALGSSWDVIMTLLFDTVRNRLRE